MSGARAPAYLAFLSHAGQQKRGFVDLVRGFLKAWGVTAFLDEHHLRTGQPNAPAMEAALRGAPVVVAVLTRDYVTKEWPMRELGIALERYSGGSNGGGGGAPGGVLLPVVLGGGGGGLEDGTGGSEGLLNLDDLGDLERRVYRRPGAWERRQRPHDATLARWAQLGKRVKGIVCTRGDQLDRFEGSLAEAVARQVVRELEELGHLTRGTLERKAPRAMLLQRPDHERVGRGEEARAVAEALRAGRSVFVCGGPGEGKSLLARSVGVALWEEGALPGGAFEVDLTGATGDIKEAVAARLVPQLKRVQGNSIMHTDADDWATLQRWLLQQLDQPTLLVLDNAEEVQPGPAAAEAGDKAAMVARAQLEQLLAAVRGASPGVRVVLTCRMRIMKPTGVVSCELSQLPLADAVGVLRQACPNLEVADAEAADVAKACGCNALELWLVGGALGRRACDAQAVIIAGRAANTPALRGRLDDAYHCDLQRLLGWWRLLLRPLFSGEQQLLMVAALSVFAGSFAADSAVSVCHEVAAASAVAAVPLSKDDVRELMALSVLEDASQSTGLPGRMAMHHLHREAAALVLAEEGSQEQLAALQRSFVRCTLALEARLKDLRTRLERGAGASAATLREEAMRLPAAEAANLSEVARLVDVVPSLATTETAGQLNKLAGELHHQGIYALAEPLVRRALAVLVEALIRRAVAVHEAVLGHDHADTALSLHNLGVVLHDQGELVEAEPLIRRALAVYQYQEVLGANHPDTATSLHNLAALLRDKGELGEAELLHRHALAVREAVVGADHPDTQATARALAACSV